MDKIDVDIIRLLLNDSRVSYNQIADRLGVSINTVRSRIDKMLKQGLIRYHTIVNP
ncbi:MAG: winged helix-turn-helix transcriptional regulator, partial [Candidatus Nitrosothermus koennekii]